MQNDDSPQRLALTPCKAIEQVCMRNLLASSKERLFFKDLDSRFVLVSAGFVEALDASTTRCKRRRRWPLRRCTIH
jgi:hypothetical protein